MDLADPQAGIEQRKIGPFCEMPVVAHADLGRPYHRGWYLTIDPAKMTMLANGPAEVLFNRIDRVSLPDGGITSFSEGPGYGFNEPVHIAANDPSHGGWLMMMVDHVVAEGYWVQEVWILVADDVASGPIAKVKMPFVTCEQVHGSWVPRRLLEEARAD
jgi:carotenoid cleavage dioxygenase